MLHISIFFTRHDNIHHNSTHANHNITYRTSNICVRACVRPCVRASVRPCVRASVRPCVRACVRPCVCMCVCVCVRFLYSAKGVLSVDGWPATGVLACWPEGACGDETQDWEVSWITWITQPHFAWPSSFSAYAGFSFFQIPFWTQRDALTVHNERTSDSAPLPQKEGADASGRPANDRHLTTNVLHVPFKFALARESSCIKFVTWLPTCNIRQHVSWCIWYNMPVMRWHLSKSRCTPFFLRLPPLALIGNLAVQSYLSLWHH